MSTDSYQIRGTRITWRGGGRPQDGFKVELEIASGLQSRAGLVAALLLGLIVGGLLAPQVDLNQVMALVESHVTQVWAMLG